MNFLANFFAKNTKLNKEKKIKESDNSKLIYLLNIYGQNPSQENYYNAFKEIHEGDSFLILPFLRNKEDTSGSKLKLTSIFNADGLKILGVFTEERALLHWNKTASTYNKIRSQDLLEFCKQIGVGKIVINNDQPNMFVLERNHDNLKTAVLETPTPIQVSRPIQPLMKDMLEKFAINFQKVYTIQEAYHYAQILNNEYSLVIGVVLSVDSENSKAALYNAVNNVIDGEKNFAPIDIFILTTGHLLNTIRNIPDSLFYKS
jgi:hypothetical protein